MVQRARRVNAVVRSTLQHVRNEVVARGNAIGLCGGDRRVGLWRARCRCAVSRSHPCSSRIGACVRRYQRMGDGRRYGHDACWPYWDCVYRREPPGEIRLLTTRCKGLAGIAVRDYRPEGREPLIFAVIRKP